MAKIKAGSKPKPEERRERVEEALKSKDMSGLSNRQIAEQLGVHRSVVQRVRDLVGDREGVPDMETRRLGADGRLYRVRRVPIADVHRTVARLNGDARLARWISRQLKRTRRGASELLLDALAAWAEREGQPPPPGTG